MLQGSDFRLSEACQCNGFLVQYYARPFKSQLRRCSILVAVSVAIDTVCGCWRSENETPLIHEASAGTVTERSDTDQPETSPKHRDKICYTEEQEERVIMRFSCRGRRGP